MVRGEMKWIVFTNLQYLWYQNPRKFRMDITVLRIILLHVSESLTLQMENKSVAVFIDFLKQIRNTMSKMLI